MFISILKNWIPKTCRVRFWSRFWPHCPTSLARSLFLSLLDLERNATELWLLLESRYFDEKEDLERNARKLLTISGIAVFLLEIEQKLCTRQLICAYLRIVICLERLSLFPYMVTFIPWSKANCHIIRT